jgi:4-aminobutyrate aminotransferase-like enzyme
VRQALRNVKSVNTSVAAIVVDPLALLGRNSDKFISELGSLARDGDAALIVDERNTGCGSTGKGFWAYNGNADYVVFGKRT